MKLPFVVKKGWVSSCQQSPRTMSFTGNRGSKSIKSAYMEDDDLIRGREREREYSIDHNHIESVIRDLPSHQGRRLLFEPGESSSSSILEAKPPSALHSHSQSQVHHVDYYFKDHHSCALVVSMESPHPYLDFRNSMHEMLQAHYPHSLHHLLSCYLNLNPNSNHPYILAAFLDLLLSLPTPTPPSTSSHHHSPSLSTSSLSSSFTTTTLSLHSSLQPQHHDASPTSSFMLQPS